MTYAIVYSSCTGNTAMLAGIIRDSLAAEDCIYVGEPYEEALNADRIYAGFWTDKGSCNSEMAAFLSKLTNQELFLFGTAGFGGVQSYYDKILERTRANLSDGVKLLGSFMCQGKMPMAVRERYEKMSSLPVPRLREMIENFDKALSHPDREDLEHLKESLPELG